MSLSLFDTLCPGVVVDPRDTGEDSGVAAAQGDRAETGAFECLPCELEQYPLLRIHRRRFARRYAEECCVESRCVVEKSTFARIRGTGPVRIRIEELVQIPAPICRKRSDRIAAIDE